MLQKTVPCLREIRRQLRSLSIVKDEVDGKTLVQQKAELEEYEKSHAARLRRSLQIVSTLATPGETLRVLELGAAPYFFTALLRRYLDCEVTGINGRAGEWPGPAGEDGTVKARVTLRQDGGKNSPCIHVLNNHVLNLEADPFPFPAASFDLVLFMETIEHLVFSPSHVLAETGRVLRPGGALLVSTPNAVDIVKTCKMALNRSIGFPYSGYGVYGRHNREYTPPELRMLVEACGYRIETIWMENPYLTWKPLSTYNISSILLSALTRVPLPYFRNKRQYIYLLARSTPQVKARYPEALYTHRDLYPHQQERMGAGR